MDFRTILLDRDGTLNADSNVVKTPDQIRLLPGVIEGLRHFRDGGAEFFIVSNQGSVGHGDDTEANALACTQRVVDLLAAGGITIVSARHCFHRRDAGCHCRKPALGMWESLLEAFPHLDPTQILMVGDKDSDVLLGKGIGARTARILSEYPHVVDADYTVHDLPALAALLP